MQRWPKTFPPLKPSTLGWRILMQAKTISSLCWNPMWQVFTRWYADKTIETL
jgi:hypothetical protein